MSSARALQHQSGFSALRIAANDDLEIVTQRANASARYSFTFQNISDHPLTLSLDFVITPVLLELIDHSRAGQGAVHFDNSSQAAGISFQIFGKTLTPAGATANFRLWSWIPLLAGGRGTYIDESHVDDSYGVGHPTANPLLITGDGTRFTRSYNTFNGTFPFPDLPPGYSFEFHYNIIATGKTNSQDPQELISIPSGVVVSGGDPFDLDTGDVPNSPASLLTFRAGDTVIGGVPEPTALSLTAVAALIALSRHRHRRANVECKDLTPSA